MKPIISSCSEKITSDTGWKGKSGAVPGAMLCYSILNLHVMVVLPPDRVYVKGDPCGESERFEQVVNHLGGDFVVRVPMPLQKSKGFVRDEVCIRRR
jgi:hypothetical protein